MYTVIFEKDGETFATYSAQASNEIEAQVQCDAFFREHPEYDPRVLHSDLIIRVEKVDTLKLLRGD